MCILRRGRESNPGCWVRGSSMVHLCYAASLIYVIFTISPTTSTSTASPPPSSAATNTHSSSSSAAHSDAWLISHRCFGRALLSLPLSPSALPWVLPAAPWLWVFIERCCFWGWGWLIVVVGCVCFWLRVNGCICRSWSPFYHAAILVSRQAAIFISAAGLFSTSDRCYCGCLIRWSCRCWYWI